MHNHELCTGFYSTSGAFDLYGCSGTIQEAPQEVSDVFMIYSYMHVQANIISIVKLNASHLESPKASWLHTFIMFGWCKIDTSCIVRSVYIFAKPKSNT